MAIAQIAAAVAALVAIAAHADTPSDEDLKRSVHERSQQIAEYRKLLDDSDQSVRLAALDVMLKSDDLAMRELAYRVGFSSTDQTMRAIALKHRISDLQTVVIKIELPKDASEIEKKTAAGWGDAYAFGIKVVDEKSGRFATSGSTATRGEGQVVGTTFDFSQKYCKGTFRLGDGAVLQGSIGCKQGWAGTYPGTIDLQ
jgi:hypothetical protein